MYLPGIPALSVPAGVANMLTMKGQCRLDDIAIRRPAGCSRISAHRYRAATICSSKGPEYTSPPNYASPGDYNILRTASEPRPVEKMEVSAKAPSP